MRQKAIASIRTMAFRLPKVTFLLSVALCGGLLYGCRPPVDHNPSGRPEALILHPRAKDVEYLKQEGTDQLTYRVDKKFPASGVIGWISYQLEEKGWEPLTYDYLNPELPSSHVQGWTKFEDATKPTAYIVHQWLAEWRDGSENIVRYGFHYRYPKDGPPNLNVLEVSAVYIPGPLAKQGQEAVRKFKEGLKAK